MSDKEKPLFDVRTQQVFRQRRNRSHIQNQPPHFDENSHLSMSRPWNHLLPVNQDGQTLPTAGERPMAVVGGIGRPNGETPKQPTAAPTTAGGGGDDLTFVRALAIPHCQHTDWEALREFRVQEMNEIRQRAAHMENTMRWWLLSAEQWREKWVLIKGERNRLREENCRLRNALAKANAEIRAMRDAKERVDTENEWKEAQKMAVSVFSEFGAQNEGKCVEKLEKRDRRKTL